MPGCARRAALQAVPENPIIWVSSRGRRVTLAKRGESVLGNAARGGASARMGRTWTATPAPFEASIPQSRSLKDNEYE
jgi:hypothetical protein